jgi:MATE family multidrug resistance protein
MNAPVIALVVAAPFNLLCNYLLVSGPIDALRLGFIGAPLSTLISINIMFIVLLVYAILRAPRKAWGGVSWACVQDLTLNVKLGLAGVGMVGSEWWSWEIVGLATSFLGPTALAAQSVLCAFPSPLSVNHAY